MKKVGVVILNYKVVEQLLKCVKSVKNSSHKELEIIVVDNASNDNSEQKLSGDKEVIFIQNEKNLGYTGGNNVGIKRALEIGCDYVFILNPDTQIDRSAISRMLALGEETGSGIIGPKIYFQNPKKIWYAGGIFDRLNVIGSHRGVDEKDVGQYDEEEATDFVTGAAMFVKKEVFEKIGLFDDKYFLYYEDSDFCFRAKQAGFEVVYYPTAVVYHANAASTGLGSSLQDYFISRNRLLFASKFLPLRTRFALFREALVNITNPNRRLALWDFLTGNLGQGSFRIR